MYLIYIFKWITDQQNALLGSDFRHDHDNIAFANTNLIGYRWLKCWEFIYYEKRKEMATNIRAQTEEVLCLIQFLLYVYSAIYEKQKPLIFPSSFLYWNNTFLSPWKRDKPEKMKKHCISHFATHVL